MAASASSRLIVHAAKEKPPRHIRRGGFFVLDGTGDGDGLGRIAVDDGDKGLLRDIRDCKRLKLLWTKDAVLRCNGALC